MAGGRWPTACSGRCRTERAGKWFDGWFPIAPDAATFARQWTEVKGIAAAAGRDPAALSGAMYLTVFVDEDAARAGMRLDAFLERYYGQPASVLRRRQAHYAGSASGLAAWLDGYAKAAVSHLVVRFAGEHERHLETLAVVRASLRS
jgi:alkanesulfonate monooxygenase SsuD/methylene tetrahydromethanopterin reductase-like flavin-dependent oxidoreductase (luciferase family)